MRDIIHINFGWEFTERFDEEFANGKKCITETVNLPHTSAQTPFDYFDESIYQMICGYRKKVKLPYDIKNKRVFLIADGAAHSSQVYINGNRVGDEHLCGYTAFQRDITEYARQSREMLITIRVNSREDQNIPPFGHVIDYMTYGGLYREVRLEIRNETYIKDVFAKAEKSGNINSEVKTEGDFDSINQTLLFEGIEITCKTFKSGTNCHLFAEYVKIWDIDTPNLYTLRTELIKNEEIVDSVDTRIGFRDAVFRYDGFYLNGRKLKIRGLNRHQSYPYVGYAMPKSMQQYDADLMKNELGLNAVRTSHYPQSQHFIDRCDEIGLLVFTEIPGWQHIGDESWKETAVRNVRDMVVQYRNHPSIILWGVRINESPDDNKFYTRTNMTAHENDPTRATGGVRCIKKSSLLEDVYTYNDFSHEGGNKGCEERINITNDQNKAYLVSEYNGHMFPTKMFDSEEHKLEHALRHARVLDSIAGGENIAGSFGWCFFDYNTHKDFGSGDRICYHGVSDMFRNRKPAADVYSSQQDREIFMQVSSTMDIGEHPASIRGRVFVFTNADSVKMYRNDRLINEYTAQNKSFKNLKHPPIEINDYIGDELKENENITEQQARYIKNILNEAATLGVSNITNRAKLEAGILKLKYGMTFEEISCLYEKYIGNWGGEATVFRFDAIKDGEVVKSVYKAPFKKAILKLSVSTHQLIEDTTYDVAAVRIKMTDQNNCELPFYNGSLKAQIRGAGELIGPSIITLRGGYGGTYIKTISKSGDIILSMTSDIAEKSEIRLTAVCK